MSGISFGLAGKRRQRSALICLPSWWSVRRNHTKNCLGVLEACIPLKSSHTTPGNSTRRSGLILFHWILSVVVEEEEWGFCMHWGRKTACGVFGHAFIFPLHTQLRFCEERKMHDAWPEKAQEKTARPAVLLCVPTHVWLADDVGGCRKCLHPNRTRWSAFDLRRVACSFSLGNARYRYRCTAEGCESRAVIS
jgi:hypothetical protein